MPDLAATLRRLADELEKEAKEEQTAAEKKASEDRIAELEARVKGASPGEKRDALEGLTDEERELIEEHRSGSLRIIDAEPEPTKDPVKEESAAPKQRLTELSIPKVYSGDDEPDIVRYTDEDGNAKTRQGRKKGVPSTYDVEDVEDVA